MTSLTALRKYFRKYRRYLILGFIFILLTNYFRVLSPQLTGFVVNAVAEGVSKKGTGPADLSGYDGLVRMLLTSFMDLPYSGRILATVLVLLGSAIISGFFMFMMRQTIIVMSRHIEFEQKNEIYDHYQSLDITFFRTHSTGDLMNRITEDVSRVRMYTGPAIMYFINLAVVISFSVFFMIKSDPQLTLLTLCPLPLLAIIIYRVNLIINKKGERVQSLLSDLTTHAQESYSGIRVIKSFVQEKASYLFFKKNAEEYRKNALSLAKTEAIYFPSMGLLIGLSTLLTIFVGGWYVLEQRPGAGVGKIAEFVMYIQMLTFPVSAIGWTASMVQRAATSQKRINEFLETEPSIRDEADATDSTLKGHIAFQNVSLTYPHTGIKALKDICLEISPGQKIAVVGRTGSGKTTLAQLLVRMFDPDSGSIRIDGTALQKFRLDSLRRQISYVPQDVFLFSDTVTNNIRFGSPEASQEQVIQAAEQASVLKDIESLPEKFETVVGERGVTLSGGQKQRISIARALLKNPGILIFDDCLSAVDSRTEKEITDRLKVFLKGKTALVITHRIMPGFGFDKILVLEEGQIVEEGSHEELLSLKGLYADLFSSQEARDGHSRQS